MPTTIDREHEDRLVGVVRRATPEPERKVGACGARVAQRQADSSAHSSRWSESARSSRTASSSNDPTNQQPVTLTPHDTLIHRP